ncbi:hypothetical protein [Methanogenium sp. MK-MG]|uniref:hypothetical protein n=1 Tax=Methanogenium sp. MK-MG TaxID=2599926 RepID=UPI0013ED560F|nr:hypothetical protein [Methanogenium sp. MK-MG]KAF1073845.1 hypothetical protein MKMG_02060 [Methanogenium sp. MK-MG]
MAVLILPFVFSHWFGKEVRFTRILICDILVSAVGIVLPFLVVRSGLSMVPALYWHTPTGYFKRIIF